VSENRLAYIPSFLGCADDGSTPRSENRIERGMRLNCSKFSLVWGQARYVTHQPWPENTDMCLEAAVLGSIDVCHLLLHLLIVIATVEASRRAIVS
jgi:hypothetical protein